MIHLVETSDFEHRKEKFDSSVCLSGWQTNVLDLSSIYGIFPSEKFGLRA